MKTFVGTLLSAAVLAGACFAASQLEGNRPETVEAAPPAVSAPAAQPELPAAVETSQPVATKAPTAKPSEAPVATHAVVEEAPAQPVATHAPVVVHETPAEEPSQAPAPVVTPKPTKAPQTPAEEPAPVVTPEPTKAPAPKAGCRGEGTSGKERADGETWKGPGWWNEEHKDGEWDVVTWQCQDGKVVEIERVPRQD